MVVLISKRSVGVDASDVAPVVGRLGGTESLDHGVGGVAVVEQPDPRAAVAVAVEGSDAPRRPVFEPDVAPGEASESTAPPPVAEYRSAVTKY